MSDAARKPLSSGPSMWDRAQPRREAAPTRLPTMTLADASSTIRFVQPQFAVAQARASAWDTARKPALAVSPSEATTGMSDLPMRVAAERHRR